MSNTFKIRKGLDIKLLGEAEKSIKEISTTIAAIKPPDFHGVFPKLLVQEGDIYAHVVAAITLEDLESVLVCLY